MSDCIRLEHVHKSYGAFALQDISLGIKEGYITGLIGPNGAGKTTLIQMIMGMVRPDRGTFSYLAGRIKSRSQRSRNGSAMYRTRIFTTSSLRSSR